uniref:Uncharacterized protein n=1 Tax=Oryza meridionalis TaxID=40149 RepID=A0A0E0CCX1_9ORYZ
MLAKLLFPYVSTLPTNDDDDGMEEAARGHMFSGEPPTPRQSMTKCLMYLLRHGSGVRSRNTMAKRPPRLCVTRMTGLPPFLSLARSTRRLNLDENTPDGKPGAAGAYLKSYGAPNRIVGAEAAGGAEGDDAGVNAGHVAVVAGDGVVHEAQLVGVARRERGVLLQRREVLPQPEPTTTRAGPASVPYAAAARRRRRLVLVGEPRVKLPARVARHQHHRVEVGAGRGPVCRRW